MFKPGKTLQYISKIIEPIDGTFFPIVWLSPF